MNIHVLPGDALADAFSQAAIDGEIIICRECLVEGDAKAAAMEDFWHVRARFIEQSCGEKPEKYFQNVRNEFEKLKTHAAAGAEINLWFEYELFCQVNFWFTLYFLGETKAKIYRVAPVVRGENDLWQGFGGLSAADLERCFAARTEMSENDLNLGAELWKAFRDADYEKLKMMSGRRSASFPFLKEAGDAAIGKETRPRAVLQGILAEGKTELAQIMPEFSARAGVYGFGDAQIKKILAEI